MCFPSDKPSTVVENATLGSPPIEGRPYTLRCHVKDGRPIGESDIVNYWWYKDGIQLENVAKELTIQNLSKFDGGTYTCEAGNVVGLGGQGESLNLSIWCKYIFLD